MIPGKLISHKQVLRINYKHLFNTLSADSTAESAKPQATMVSKDVALDMAYRYYEAVVNSDISRVDDGFIVSVSHIMLS